MTREEAIKRFETLLLHVDTDCVMGMETTEAINMAIKALEQPEPCEDAVSRADCLQALSNMMDIDGFRDGWAVSRANVECMLKSMPSAQPEQSEPCELCSNLGKGDTLYQSSDWDGGIGFDYIRDIQFCPKCGRRLE